MFYKNCALLKTTLMAVALSVVVQTPFAMGMETEKKESALSKVIVPTECLENATIDRDLCPQIMGLSITCFSKALFNEFPMDVHQIILSNLTTLSDFANLAGTCKFWHAFVSENIQGAVVVMGSGGSGKSSLVHLLAGKQLMGEKEGTVFGPLHLVAKENLPNIHIEPRPMAGTLEVNTVIDFCHKRIIYDCPGFGDSRGKDYDFINSLAIQKILKGNIKIILVVPESQLSSGYGRDFNLLINKLTEIFPNQDQLENILSLIISFQKEKEEMLERYLQFGREKYQDFLTKRGADLLKSLISDGNYAYFVYPKQEGAYEVSEKLRLLLNKQEYVLNPQITMPIKEAVTAGQQRWSSPTGYDKSGKQCKYFS